MKKFSVETSCKKCGCSKASIEYRFVTSSISESDTIERICERCKYKWHEEPLDRQED